MNETAAFKRAFGVWKARGYCRKIVYLI